MAIEFTRVSADINGNSRHVCHFLNFIKEDEKASYEVAIKRGNKLGGRKFHNKQYGGGIVFQVCEGMLPKLEKRIVDSLK